MKFGHLRNKNWNPTFEWVETRLECADKINSYHEDYPKYVGKTNDILQIAKAGLVVPNYKLLIIHEAIFTDKSFKGRWRDVGVVVGEHHPPRALDIPALMKELTASYLISNIETLIEWYKDFETIHPFQDGNGRVGGVTVAVYAHALHPEKGWLAPDQ